MGELSRAEFDKLLGVLEIGELGSDGSPVSQKSNTAISQQAPKEDSSSIWTQESESFGAEEKERIILRNGLVRLDLFSSPRMLLKWDGRVPDYLRPQDDPDMLVDKFLPWVFEKLPKKMGLYRRTGQGTRKYYRGTTDFELGFTDGSVRRYDLSDDKGMVGFSQAFTRRAGEINRMLILGGKTPALGERHFGLELSYRPGVLLREEMSLSWQVNSKGVKACDTAVAEWVLKSVSGSDQLGDLAKPVFQMAGILRERTRAAIKRK